MPQPNEEDFNLALLDIQRRLHRQDFAYSQTGLPPPRQSSDREEAELQSPLEGQMSREEAQERVRQNLQRLNPEQLALFHRINDTRARI